MDSISIDNAEKAPFSFIMENIYKMIICGDPSFGGAMYGCPHCGKLKFVTFRCHSRFCPAQGRTEKRCCIIA